MNNTSQSALSAINSSNGAQKILSGDFTTSGVLIRQNKTGENFIH